MCDADLVHTGRIVHIETVVTDFIIPTYPDGFIASTDEIILMVLFFHSNQVIYVYDTFTHFVWGVCYRDVFQKLIIPDVPNRTKRIFFIAINAISAWWSFNGREEIQKTKCNNQFTKEKKI